MFQTMMTGAPTAGTGAELPAAELHFAFIQNFILSGEEYESGALVPVAAAPQAADHKHRAAFSARVPGVGLAGWLAGRQWQRGAA